MQEQTIQQIGKEQAAKTDQQEQTEALTQEKKFRWWIWLIVILVIVLGIAGYFWLT